jgi:hypothetical protein
MRYAQTVRFNLSTDREKIDSSSLEVQAAIDLTNAASGEKTLTGTETGDLLKYLIERSPQRDERPDKEFIIINTTNENLELGSQITFTEKVGVNDENPEPPLSYLILNGGILNLFEGDAKLQISNVQNIEDASGNSPTVTPTNMSELTDESFSMKYTDQASNDIDELIFDANSLSLIDTNNNVEENRIDIEPNKISHTNNSGNMSELTVESFSMKYTDQVTNDIDELIFNANSLSLIDTNNNVEENRIDIEPNKISFTTKTEQVTTFDSTTTDPTSSILGVNTNINYSEIIIELNNPRNSGPEYKLTVNTIENAVQTISFTMNINNGNWFDKVVNYTEINVDSFKTGADIITFSRNMSSFNAGNENLFYMRDSNQIKIAWKESAFNGIDYELIQVA